MRTHMSVVVAIALSSVVDVGAQTRYPVTISVDQDGGLSAAQLELAIGEVQEIWRDAGVVITSCRFGEPSRAGEARVSLRIMRTLPPGAYHDALAWLAVDANGRPIPVVFVSLTRVTTFLSDAEFAHYSVSALSEGIRERLMARAIGRLAAHELGHYLLQKPGHTHHGLMRGRCLANELVGQSLRPFLFARAEPVAIRPEVSVLARSRPAF